MRSIEILIPSFRLDAGPLLAILDLEVPPATEVRWIIVGDDPEARVPPAVASRVDGTSVRVLVNPSNIGSAGSRNVALDASSAEWVLFLDDDVTPAPDLLLRYAEASVASPDALGFFGPTLFLPATTLYQRGVEVSDILTFFRIATYSRSLRWAPTSNVMVRGDAARAERFRTVFPKGGGGEDIDYLLRVSDRAGLPLLAVPSAAVNHPWWFDGARDYTRFTRWSFGDSLLHDLHPQFTYRAAPNAVELLALAVPVGVIASICTSSPAPIAAVLIGIPLGEIAGEYLRLLWLKGFPDCLYCFETVLIRSANDLGRLAMQVRRRRWRAITERWDHFCDGQHVAYHKRWAALKFGAHLGAAAFVGGVGLFVDLW